MIPSLTFIVTAYVLFRCFERAVDIATRKPVNWWAFFLVGLAGAATAAFVLAQAASVMQTALSLPGSPSFPP
jgi:hypothetical protein